MKRTICVVFTLLLLICVLPVTVFANSPPPWPVYQVEITNLPEETRYVDMLIKLPEDDSKYVPLVAENLPDGFSEDAQIISYCEDDYRSYTFHYAEAASMIKIPEDSTVYFFTKDGSETLGRAHLEEVYARGKIRLAVLDEAGNILQLSKPQSLQPMHLLDYDGYDFSYDAQTDKLIRESRGRNPALVLMYILVGISGTLFTCAAERLIAWPFGLGKKHGKLIVKTNIVSQITMRILFLPLYTLIFRRYYYAVFFLEILIYAGEAVLYCWRMKTISWKRVVLYTVVANTVTLASGLLIWGV